MHTLDSKSPVLAFLLLVGEGSYEGPMERFNLNCVDQVCFPALRSLLDVGGTFACSRNSYVCDYLDACAPGKLVPIGGYAVRSLAVLLGECYSRCFFVSFALNCHWVSDECRILWAGVLVCLDCESAKRNSGASAL